LRRRGFSNERINAIQEVYRILYIRGYNTSQAVSIIEADFPASADRDEILAFISRSTRGLMKGYGKIDRRIL
jgi:UDP-N-acetylglucosamine acyltransferase